MNQIVMRELKVLAASMRLVMLAFRARPFRVRWRYEPDLGVENPDQILKLLRTIGIARHLQQLVLRPHAPLDVGAGIWQ